MDFVLFIGVIGLACILLAFYLEEFTPHTRHESLLYNDLNLIGSLLLLVYALTTRTWPFVVLNAIWAVFASLKLWRLIKRH